MKIEKRFLVSPMTTINLWLIPTLMYGIGKLLGTEYNEYEYVWWIGIPTLFLAWFILNFKIVKDK
jgi:hypothetical protein